jgi:hypothetical protein
MRPITDGFSGSPEPRDTSPGSGPMQVLNAAWPLAPAPQLINNPTPRPAARSHRQKAAILLALALALALAPVPHQQLVASS